MIANECPTLREWVHLYGCGRNRWRVGVWLRVQNIFLIHSIYQRSLLAGIFQFNEGALSLWTIDGMNRTSITSYRVGGLRSLYGSKSSHRLRLLCSVQSDWLPAFNSSPWRHSFESRWLPGQQRLGGGVRSSGFRVNSLQICFNQHQNNIRNCCERSLESIIQGKDKR